METVFRRFIHLKLDVRNTKLVTSAGSVVSAAYKAQSKFPLELREKIFQTEILPGSKKTCEVFSYPDEWVEEMDKRILKCVHDIEQIAIIKKQHETKIEKPKRKRMSVLKVNIK